MSTQVPNVNKTNAGLCPHGLPPAACPICSKMAGGGGLRAGERPQKAGEMSYHECVVIGNMIRARELAAKRHALQLEQQANALKLFESTMNKISENLKSFIQKMEGNVITKPVAIVAQAIALPLVKFVQSIPRFFQLFQNIKFEIQDKLNAIFGELKNFVQKKISDIVSALKIKFEGLFKIFKKKNAEDDDTKIDDDKKIFNLKKILQKIIRKKKDDDNSKNKQ